jgi:hypothetical protein
MQLSLSSVLKGSALKRSTIALLSLILALFLPGKLRASPSFSARHQAATQQAGSAKAVGTITAIAANSITLKPDSGAEMIINVDDSAKMARVAPGQTDLKGATVIHLADLQVGDRVLVRATPSADGKTFTAAVVIAMKHSDVQAKQQQERQDWQKRGIGGLVSAVDPTSGAVTVTMGAGPAKKTVAIHTTSTTIFRRYAPDSVKFDDAKPSSLDQIKPGDQVRALGNRNSDGTEFAAEQVVSGTFRNIAGTIDAVDAGVGTITVKDLLSRKSIVVRISADSQVRKLPQQMAQMMAMRLKGGAGANGGAGGAGGAQPQPTSGSFSPNSGNGQSHYGGAGVRPGGAPDLQQILSRMPPASISDLQKGDVVMIVSTEGTDSGSVTAITLLSGVEPLLQASPGSAQAMMLSPWSLGGGGGDEGGGGSPQ